MKGLLVLPIYLVCLGGLVVAKEDNLSCFVTGECTESPHVGGAVVENKEGCLELCKYYTVNGLSLFTAVLMKRVGAHVLTIRIYQLRSVINL